METKALVWRPKASLVLVYFVLKNKQCLLTPLSTHHEIQELACSINNTFRSLQQYNISIQTIMYWIEWFQV